MREIDKSLATENQPPLFFKESSGPFIDPRDWGTLIHLINEDYDDMSNKRSCDPTSHGYHLLERLDNAAEKSGITPRFAALEATLRKHLADTMEAQAGAHLIGKQASYPDSLEEKTVLIEFARGGPSELTPPLPAPWGYQYSLTQLAPQILETANILYVQITPEEAEAKNDAINQPTRIPSNLMAEVYGCDDIAWLEEASDTPATIRVEAHKHTYHLPLRQFDNREDITGFLRSEPDNWPPEKLRELHLALQEQFTNMGKN
jgi:hypothetical protein